MREKIHPQYMDCTVRCSCGNTWTTRATVPSMTLDLCNKCHPFYTGTQKLVDTGGRVQRFADKFGSAAQAQLERAAAQKAARAQAAAAADAKRREAHEAKAAAKAERTKRYAEKQEDAKRKAEEAAGDVEIVRPIFEPGDALFFDEMCLHQTASDPSMPNPRFAIESWFFGASGFPADYAPVAVR